MMKILTIFAVLLFSFSIYSFVERGPSYGCYVDGDCTVVLPDGTIITSTGSLVVDGSKDK